MRLCNLFLVRKYQIACFGGHPVLVLAGPFHVAANGVGFLGRGSTPFEQGVNSIAQFVGGFFSRRARVVVHAPGVAKFAVGVENIVMWRSQSAVIKRGLLRLVV